MDCARCQQLTVGMNQIFQILSDSHTLNRLDQKYGPPPTLKDQQFWQRIEAAIPSFNLSLGCNFDNSVQGSLGLPSTEYLSFVDFPILEELLQDSLGEKFINTLLGICNELKIEVPEDDIYTEAILPSLDIKGGFQKIAQAAATKFTYMKGLTVFSNVLTQYKIKIQFWKLATSELVSEYISWKAQNDSQTHKLGYMLRMIMDRIFLNREIKLRPPTAQVEAIKHPTTSFCKKEVKIGPVSFKLSANQIVVSKKQTPSFSLLHIHLTSNWSILYPLGPFLMVVGHSHQKQLNIIALLIWTGEWLELVNQKTIKCKDIGRSC